MSALLVLAPLEFAAITAVALLLGCRVASWLHPMRHHGSAWLGYGLATGYLLLGLAVAAVGLTGLLTRPVVLALLIAGTLAGAPEAPHVWERMTATARRASKLAGAPGVLWRWLCLGLILILVFSAAIAGSGLLGTTPWVVAMLCVFGLTVVALWRPRFGAFWLLAAWCLVTLLAALAPPADSDWDGLAEHLAQAKIYATTGRYQPLWYDHHSHFPSLTQMLFTVGMLFHGPALAKLFHWGYGVLGLAACWWLGRRTGGRDAGIWAALTYAGTPLIGWLMQVGYVDLSTTAYGLLAVLAFLEWRREGSSGALTLSGIMAGAMMGTKMQGLSLFGVLLLATAVVAVHRCLHGPSPPQPGQFNETEPNRTRGLSHLAWARGVRDVVRFGLVAVVVGGGWYIKSWVLTGNPVYPFAYGLFGGKYWGPEEARAYEYHQKSFGVGQLPPPDDYWSLPPGLRRFLGPRSPANLLLAPWNVTFNPVPFTDFWSQGDRALYPVLLSNWIGPMYFFGLGLMAVAWLRARVMGCRDHSAERADSTIILWLFLPLWAWWLLSMQYTRYLIPSLVLLAPVVGRAWTLVPGLVGRVVHAAWMGVALGMVTYVASPALTVPTGLIPADVYARATCPVYEPSQVLNRVVPPNGKVILFGEPRGFYIDREYLWGDPGHHRLIPYDQLQTASALLAHFRGMGITHVLVNVGQTGPLGSQHGPPLSLLADAVAKGLAQTVDAEELRGKPFVILDIR